MIEALWKLSRAPPCSCRAAFRRNEVLQSSEMPCLQPQTGWREKTLRKPREEKQLARFSFRVQGNIAPNCAMVGYEWDGIRVRV